VDLYDEFIIFSKISFSFDLFLFFLRFFFLSLVFVSTSFWFENSDMLKKKFNILIILLLILVPD